MCVLRRFPVSDEFSAYPKTLDFDSNRIIQFAFFSKMETFWAKHGNVGNGLAHRLEVLSGVCGACFRSKSSCEVRNEQNFSFS